MSKKILRRATKIVLIYCNIAVALFLLAGCYGSWLDPQRFWFTGFFTLASFYFLVVLIGFIFFWLFAKPMPALISIIAIVLTWNPLKQIIAIQMAPNFTMQKHPSNLRVMSWNVEHFDILEHKSHPERKQQMIDMINAHQPDVACFQEMVASDQFAAAINYVPDFMAKLNMHDYHFSYNPKLDFDGRHHFGIIIFSKYPIINKRTVAYAPKDYNSTFQYVDIVKGNDTFRIFNIHLQSLKFSNDNLKYIETPSINNGNNFEESKSVAAKFKTGFLKRRIQSERIKAEMMQSPYPVIVCGDFNDVPNSYAYNKIGKGMHNAFTEKGTGIGRTFYGISPTLRIDNIFADERFNVEQFVRIKKKLSDHFPIIADLFYKSSTPPAP